MVSITSVEVNFLVYRYLQESGLIHSAFALGYEAGLSNCSIDGNMVPPGALIKFIQKGLQYLEMEANLSNNEADLDEDFSFIGPLDLITKDVYQLREMIKERKKSQDKHMDKAINKRHAGKSGGVTEREKLDNRKEHRNRELGQVSEREKQENEKDHQKSTDTKKIDEHKVKQHDINTDTEMVVDQEDRYRAKHKENEISEGPQAMDISNTSIPRARGIHGADVMILEGHSREVCACAWSPTGSLLASGSGDSTARIWSISDRIDKVKSGNCNPAVLLLEHAMGKASDANKDVTSLDWNWDGSLLATGCYDGHARIWTLDGKLRSTLTRHIGPIFSIKWNKKGDYILTGSLDTTAIVWDVKTKGLKQQFKFHSGPTLDTDWRNNVSFATSTDTMIHVCKIGKDSPVKSFYGHLGEVNSVKWDPTGSLLASSSDDNTAKIWSLKEDKYLQDFRDHAKGIYTIRWSPTGQGTNNPNKQLMLASASFDSTVKIWDVELGKLLVNLNGHRDAVYSIAFSPDGEYLASGSKDKSIHIWSLKESRIVKSYSGDGSVFEVCWNKEGDKVAACTNRNEVVVLDIRS